MIRLFEWLFYGHAHKWKRIGQGPFERYDGSHLVTRGTHYVCECEKCGRIKTFYSY